MKRAVILSLTMIIAVIFAMPGCGQSHKSSRGGFAVTGTGSGSGSGTNTNTNTGNGAPASATASDLVISIKLDAQASSLERIRAGIESVNSKLWTAVHGQNYFREVTIRDKTDDQSPGEWPEGHIWIGDPEGTTIGPGTPYDGFPAGIWWLGSRAGVILLPGRFYQQGLLHEWGHFMMDRKNEEYDCMKCFMGRGVPGNTPTGYCDGSNCSVSDPCWDKYFSKAQPSWIHPASHDADPPAINFIITDN
ncbi:MAG: hypothetical protein E3J72_11325 [Planctomycetota bacterium]|nr:MAG: hypothetical protein E3J72_11325 [Planctomycetota bacterium]